MTVNAISIRNMHAAVDTHRLMGRCVSLSRGGDGGFIRGMEDSSIRCNVHIDPTAPWTVPRRCHIFSIMIPHEPLCFKRVIRIHHWRIVLFFLAAEAWDNALFRQALWATCSVTVNFM